MGTMYTRILTEPERNAINKYLRKDGTKEIQVRKAVYRAKRYLPRIRKDLELLQRLLETYQKPKKA